MRITFRDDGDEEDDDDDKENELFLTSYWPRNNDEQNIQFVSFPSRSSSSSSANFPGTSQIELRNILISKTSWIFASAFISAPWEFMEIGVISVHFSTVPDDHTVIINDYEYVLLKYRGNDFLDCSARCLLATGALHHAAAQVPEWDFR